MAASSVDFGTKVSSQASESWSFQMVLRKLEFSEKTFTFLLLDRLTIFILIKLKIQRLSFKKRLKRKLMTIFAD